MEQAFIYLLACFACQLVESLKQGYQAMVFVHSRKDTAKTAEKLVSYKCPLGKRFVPSTFIFDLLYR